MKLRLILLLATGILSSCDSSDKQNQELPPEQQLENMGILNENYEQQLLTEAAHGTVKVIRLLLAADTDINTTDSRGRTPLHIAAESGRLRIVKLLIRRGASINASDKENKTPLALAIQHKHTAIIKVNYEFEI